MKNSNALYDHNGKVVAQLKNGWIEKFGIDPAKHKLRSPEGYATDRAHVLKLSQTSEPKGVRLRLVDGTVLEASLSDFLNHSVYISRGYGEQLVLPIKWWVNAHDPKPAKMF